MCVHTGTWDLNGPYGPQITLGYGEPWELSFGRGNTEAWSVTGAFERSGSRDNCFFLSCPLSSPWKKLWEVSGL